MDDESILADAIRIFDEQRTIVREQFITCRNVYRTCTVEERKTARREMDNVKNELTRYTLMISNTKMIICKMNGVHHATQCIKEMDRKNEKVQCRKIMWTLNKSPLCDDHGNTGYYRKQTKRPNVVVESVVQEPKQKMHRVHDACDDDEGGPDIQIDELKNGTDIVAVPKKQQPIIKQKTKLDKIHVIATKMVDEAFAKVFGSSYKLHSEK